LISEAAKSSFSRSGGRYAAATGNDEIIITKVAVIMAQLLIKRDL
jgi:hypothetical protein